MAASRITIRMEPVIESMRKPEDEESSVSVSDGNATNTAHHTNKRKLERMQTTKNSNAASKMWFSVSPVTNDAQHVPQKIHEDIRTTRKWVHMCRFKTEQTLMWNIAISFLI